jgi:cysteinyl-tRNA synthetase
LPEIPVPAEVTEALSDDLNTPNAITALRGLYSDAKKGGLEEVLKFAAGCKFLGFRELNRPGLFESGVSGINVETKALLDHKGDIVRLRAAMANNAPEAVKNNIISSIRKENLDVEISKRGKITLVGEDEAFTKKVNALCDARNAARKARNFAEADRIREELAAMGVELEDHKGGTTTWKAKR